MNKIIVTLAFLTAIGLIAISYPDGAIAALMVSIFSALTIYIIRQTGDDKDFLVNVFLLALIARILFGMALHIFEWREFFGGDALTYDFFGNRLVEIWTGQITNPNDWLSQNALRTSGPGWGMNYLVGSMYFLFGRSILTAQSFCGFFGAATAPLVYTCAYNIFNNRRVGKLSALLVAFFPAFIIWSSQLLKDGLIIFLLVLIMTMILQLQKRLNYLAIGILILALFGILSLRFYIFYMVVIAVAGSFVIGASGSVKNIVRGFILLVLVGIGLTYLGVLRSASVEFERFGSLERVQNSRQDLARSGSGFGDDIDVSTPEGAIAAIPIGFSYLMLAPFPWEVTNFRQAITLPEMLVWWSLIPLLIMGLVYTLKNRLRNAIAVLIFTSMLTIAYSIFQGNVGTAYRQRAQIQVFLFIFIAVGWTLMQEKKENKQFMRQEKQRQKEKSLRETGNEDRTSND